jgi:hypothetical protein
MDSLGALPVLGATVAQTPHRTSTLPSTCAVTHLGPVGAIEISGNTSGRVANKGMKGLTIPPDSKMLVGIMQAPLIQDGGKTVQIVTMDIATGTIHQYVYTLTTGSGVREIVAVNEHTFLVDKHDGKGLGDGATAVVQHLYHIKLAEPRKSVMSVGQGSSQLRRLMLHRRKDVCRYALAKRIYSSLSSEGRNDLSSPGRSNRRKAAMKLVRLALRRGR